MNALCDGWHKMLTSLASCANRHKAGPGNIMQPPGTKVGQGGTKGFDEQTIKELKTLGCLACGECRWESNTQGSFADLHCTVTANGKVCSHPSSTQHYRYWTERFKKQDDDGAGPR